MPSSTMVNTYIRYLPPTPCWPLWPRYLFTFQHLAGALRSRLETYILSSEDSKMKKASFMLLYRPNSKSRACPFQALLLEGNRGKHSTRLRFSLALVPHRPTNQVPRLPQVTGHVRPTCANSRVQAPRGSSDISSLGHRDLRH